MRRIVRKCLSAVALSGLALAARGPASADETAHFATVGRSGEAAEIGGHLTKPRGRGPFPAVVLFHSCLGLPANQGAIAEALTQWGYVALFVDDFAARGLSDTCTVDFPEGVADAFGALAYLSRLPYVDPARIAAVGYSQGADTALRIAALRSDSSHAAGGARIRAAAAFYPPCENQAGAAMRIPTLILVGGADTVTPAVDCERLKQAQPGDGSRLKLVVYPGAAHGFDNPEFGDGRRLFGMTLKYDRVAAERSSAELRAFLARALAR